MLRKTTNSLAIDRDAAKRMAHIGDGWRSPTPESSLFSFDDYADAQNALSEGAFGFADDKVASINETSPSRSMSHVLDERQTPGHSTLNTVTPAKTQR